MRFEGRVVAFNPGRGFGYVLRDGDRTNTFVHVSDVRNSLLLREGDRVAFGIGQSKKGPRCLDVEILQDAPAERCQ